MPQKTPLDALRDLVALKDMEDREGPISQYRERVGPAWEAARRVLLAVSETPTRGTNVPEPTETETLINLLAHALPEALRRAQVGQSGECHNEPNGNVRVNATLAPREVAAVLAAALSAQAAPE